LQSGLLTILLKSIGNTNTNLNFKNGLQYQYLFWYYQYFDRSVFNMNRAVSQHGRNQFIEIVFKSLSNATVTHRNGSLRLKNKDRRI